MPKKQTAGDAGLKRGAPTQKDSIQTSVENVGTSLEDTLNEIRALLLGIEPKNQRDALHKGFLIEQIDVWIHRYE